MRALLFAVALGLTFLASTSVSAQTPAGDSAITATGAIGEVKSIDATAKQLTIKTDAGSEVSISLTDKTAYMRLAPGEQTLTNAAKITITDVAQGDRVWARGRVSEDKKSVPSATAIIVMTKADITKKQEAERAEWRRRGILGVVTALKPDTHEITITHRAMGGNQTVIIPVTDKTEMRRYAPDSIKFSDAKPATFTELKVGDQLRALGDRSEDGLKFSPEKVVTGSFRTVAGTVTAVDAATGEVKIRDLEKKTPLTIVIKQDAVLRKFPPASETALRLSPVSSQRAVIAAPESAAPEGSVTVPVISPVIRWASAWGAHASTTRTDQPQTRTTCAVRFMGTSRS